MFSWSQHLVGPTNIMRKVNRMRLCLDLPRKPFHLTRYFLHTQVQKNNDVNYHHYNSLTPLGGLRATEGRTCDASQSEAGCTWIQRESTRSSIGKVMHPDSSSSSLVSRSKEV
jgi:hypothetical protein